MKKCMCGVAKLGGALVLIGAVNWGLVGLGMLMNGNYNVVNLLLGSWPMVEAIVYLLVGIAAFLVLFGCKCAKCKACMAGTTAPAAPTQM